jgi:ABC-2 type transport system permease protein
MKQYLRVVRQLLSSYLSAALMYRADFLQSVFSSLLWSGFSFVSALLISSQTPDIPGLQRSDLLLLAAAYGIIVGMHHWLCNRGFEEVSDIIHRGELDGFLLKPFHTLTLLSLRNVSWGSVPRILGSVVLFGILLHLYNQPVTLFSAIAFAVLSCLSFLLIYGIHTMSCTVLIWHPYLSNIVYLAQNLIGSARYPLNMRLHVPTFAIALYIPFLFIVNIPVRALVGQLALLEFISFLICSIGVFVFSQWFWRYALRSYTGASG